MVDLTGEWSTLGKPFRRCFFARKRLLAGYYAGDLDPAVALGKLASLRKVGVDRIIDLTEDGEYGLLPYAEHLEGIKYERRAIRDMSVPLRESMKEILDAIDHALDDGETVYVHCWGGIGRTGTVVGCHLRRHGASADEAFAALRRGLLEMEVPQHPEMPQTPAQFEMVRTWEPGE